MPGYGPTLHPLPAANGGACPVSAFVVTNEPGLKGCLGGIPTPLRRVKSVQYGTLMVVKRFSRRPKKSFPPNLDVAATVLRAQTAPASLKSDRSALAVVQALAEVCQLLPEIIRTSQLIGVPLHISETIQNT
jgi:hypothetical protein